MVEDTKEMFLRWLKEYSTKTDDNPFSKLYLHNKSLEMLTCQCLAMIRKRTTKHSSWKNI